MKRSQIVWIAILVVAGIYLAIRAASGNMGQVYVRERTVKPKDSDVTWQRYQTVDPRLHDRPGVSLSWPRTIGLWISAFLTLCIFSFLYGDNVFYRFAESVFIGVSAAYVMVVGFWTGICGNLFGKLVPELMQATVLPGLKAEPNYWYAIALVLSVLMLMRLSPTGGWISRWPLAFFIGATAGFRLVGFFEADFMRQIQSTIFPLIVLKNGEFDFEASINNLLIIIGVLSGLVYFFFSVEHKGVIGHVSRLGIWFLMIAFGASFGYTVMGRIALLAQRLEFLVDDWLWIIDPLGRRAGM